MNQRVDNNNQPHVIQRYHVPSPQNNQYRRHDEAVYSMWMSKAFKDKSQVKLLYLFFKHRDISKVNMEAYRRVETILYDEMKSVNVSSDLKSGNLMETHIIIHQKLFTYYIPYGVCCVKKFL